ncbi:MAG: hypothetical protein ACI8SJ_001535 [Shewanella sp.]|jgi:hypothetical protein
MLEGPAHNNNQKKPLLSVAYDKFLSKILLFEYVSESYYERLKKSSTTSH